MSRLHLLAPTLTALGALVAVQHAGAAAPPGCAPHEPRLVAPVGVPGPLVRPGAARLLLCRYRGLNPASTALQLRSSRVISDRAEIGSIVAALNALPKARARVSCPMDDGSAILATFVYPAGPVATVRVGLRGCRTVTGLHPPVRTAASPGGARLIANLERLAP
jgi:hypothetical protein